MIYTLSHRGEEFRMHGIGRVVTNSAFVCNLCHRTFALDAVAALLGHFVDSNDPRRDITCCQVVNVPTVSAVQFVHLPTALAVANQSMLNGGPTAGIPRLPDAVKDVLPPPIPGDDEPVAEHLPGEPGFEHEVEREPAVCRWCKGTREITINFKTKPCDECANEDGTVGPEDVGVGWKVKKAFRTVAWLRDKYGIAQ